MARSFFANRDGVAAIEFALVIPILILLYLGSVEASFSVAVHKKMESTGSAISELVARETSVTTQKLDDILKISNSMMYPYPVKNLDITILGVDNREKGKIVFRWIRSLSGKNQVKYDPALAADISKLEGNFFIVVQSTYKYTPLSGVTSAAFEMQGLAIARARLTDNLTCTNC